MHSKSQQLLLLSVKKIQDGLCVSVCVHVCVRHMRMCVCMCVCVYMRNLAGSNQSKNMDVH